MKKQLVLRSIAIFLVAHLMTACELPVTPKAGLPPLPAAPSDIETSDGNTQATITWQPVSGAASYNLYFATSAGVTTGGTKVAGVTSPYLHTGLTNGTTYYYRVSALNASGESALSAEVSITSHTVLHGSQTALLGTWTTVSEQSFISNDEPATYTKTLKWTFDGENFSSDQVNGNYSNGSLPQTFLGSGAVTYNPDGTLTIEQTHEKYRENEWKELSPPRVMYYRNLVVDGVFHPSTWVRIGAGKGIGGTWETVALKSGADLVKVRYQIDAQAKSLSGQQFLVDENFAIADETGSPMNNNFTWDGDEMTMGSYVTPFRLLANDQFADAPLGSSSAAPVFTKQ